MPKHHKALVCLLVSFSASASAQTIGGCPVFPANNIWNARVDALPLHSRSGAWVTSIGSTAVLHPDFGGELYLGLEPGIPYNLVTGSQPKVPITITPGADESDPGPYPYPPAAKVESGSDRHVLVVDTTNCLLYESFDSVRNANNSWTVYSGAIFDLRKNLLRPPFWTSADAAGLPILPGLARYEEILAGEIKHALRFTAPRTSREFIWPARHYASSSNDLNLPPMGARFRMKANFDISSFSPTTQIILTALKRYGMMLADNGSPWYIQGSFDPGWPNIVDEWRRIPGSAFEAVDTSSLMDSADSAAVKGSGAAPVTLQSAALTQAAVTGGQPATLRVVLSGAAAAGGVQVALASDQAAASIASAVLVPEGSSTMDVPVSTTPVATATSVTLSASYSGLTRQATLSVNAPAPTLQSAAFLNASVTGGQGATLRLTLSAVAGPGGATVSLSSANSAVASIAGSVVIPSGSATADVQVATTAVTSAQSVLFTAAYAGLTRQASLTVDSPAPTLQSAVFLNASVPGGQGATLRLTLSAVAGPGGATVTLSSANSAVASIAGSVVIPSGSATADVPVSTTAVTSAQSVLFTAAYAGLTRQASLTVDSPAPTLQSAAFLNASVIGGQGATLRLTLSAVAGPGGATVTLSSANSAVASIAGSVVVPSGSATADVQVATTAVTSAQSVLFTAGYAGLTRQASLTVNAPAPVAALQSLTPGAASLIGGTATSLDVRLSQAAPAGGLAITLASSNPAAATTPSSQITVPAGATSVSVPVATNPVAAATPVTFTASAAGIVRQANLTVRPPAVTQVGVNPTSVVGGVGCNGTVHLNGKAPAGGLTVLLASGNTNAATVAGSVNISAGQTSATFPITTKSVASSAVAAIQGAFQGTSAISNLTVMPAPAPTLTAISAALNANTLTVTATLSGPASLSGARVALSGSNNQLVTLNGATLFVPANATQASVNLTVLPTTADVTLTVSGTWGGVTRSTSVFVPKQTAAPTVTLARLDGTNSISLGGTGFLWISLTGRLPVGAPLPVVSATGAIGQTTWLSTLTGGRATLALAFRGLSRGAGAISVTYGGVTKTFNVTVR